MADIHLNQATTLLKTLARKLYHMNSKELDKFHHPGKTATIDECLNEIFQCPPQKNPIPALSGKTGTDAVLLGLEPAFEGDRVFTVMYGLYTMIHAAYSHNCELFMTDTLDAQALYNSARNVEILIWALNNRHDNHGRLLLETNQTRGPVRNLSFERIFGQLIAVQDTMARIAASKSGRMVTQVVHQVAGMAFLPL